MKKFTAILLLIVIMCSLLAVLALADNTDIISPELTPTPSEQPSEDVVPAPQTGETGTVILVAVVGVFALCGAACLVRKALA